jgi:penicillin-binding protein 2
LQIASLMAAVATGRRVTPRLLLDAPPTETLAGLPFRAKHLAVVREALEGVVEDPEGTGKRANLEGLRIAGKTGTAQVVAQETWTKNEELPPKLRDHAWFASWAPAEDPRLAVAVFVEHGGGGSTSAAPLARELYRVFFRDQLPESERLPPPPIQKP